MWTPPALLAAGVRPWEVELFKPAEWRALVDAVNAAGEGVE